MTLEDYANYRKQIGASQELTNADLDELSVDRERVLALMLDGLWHTTLEITGAAVGTEGMRRFRELKQRGYRYEKRKVSGHRIWEYRLLF